MGQLFLIKVLKLQIQIQSKLILNANTIGVHRVSFNATSSTGKFLVRCKIIG